MSFFQQIIQDSVPPASRGETAIPGSHIDFSSTPTADGSSLPTRTVQEPAGPIAAIAPTATDLNHQPQTAPAGAIERAMRPAAAERPITTEPGTRGTPPIEAHPSGAEFESLPTSEMSPTHSQDRVTEDRSPRVLLPEDVSGREQRDRARAEEAATGQAGGELATRPADQETDVTTDRQQAHHRRHELDDNPQQDFRSPSAVEVDQRAPTSPTDADVKNAPEDRIGLAPAGGAETGSPESVESLIREPRAPKPAGLPDRTEATASVPASVIVESPTAAARSTDAGTRRPVQIVAAPKVLIRQIDIVIQSAAPARSARPSGAASTNPVPWYLRTV